MKTFRLASLAFALALAGCISVPEVAHDPKPIDAAKLGLAPEPVVMADEAWWSAYGDPQLDRVMRETLEGNPTLAGAIARIRSAQAAADIAGAGTKPTVSYTARGQYQRFSEEDLIPPPYGGGSYWQGRQGLDLSWTIDFWGKQAALIDQSRSRLDAAKLDAAAARIALAGAVLQSYLDLDRSYLLADLAKRTQEQREGIYDLTRDRVRAGLGTGLELKEAESAVPSARVDVSQAEADQQKAIHRLAALTGRGTGSYASYVRPQPRRVQLLALPDAVPADMLARRPDILAARARVDAATFGQAAAKASFYPDINIAAFAGTAAIGFANLFDAHARNYGVGPAIHLPIFDAGRLKAEYRNASAEIDTSVALYNELVLNAVRQVADQVTSVSSIRYQVGEQAKAVEAADAAYRLAVERHRAGLETYLVVLNAETLQLSARRRLIELQNAQAVARVSLLIAVGGSFDNKIGEKS